MTLRRKPSKEQELISDLQRLRADFENYRKNIDKEKAQLSELARAAMIVKILPILDTIERAIAHLPGELKANKWAQGVVGLGKSLDKLLGELQLNRIDAKPGTHFN